MFQIPQIDNAQRIYPVIKRFFDLRDQTQRELMNEPRVGATIPRRIDSFFAPLQKPLRVSECSFLFSVTGSREKENFGIDVLSLQLTALDLGRFAPEI